MYISFKFFVMKYLVKTDNSGTLEEVDYTRVIWDTTDDNVLIQNTIGGGGEFRLR